jgi:hypothetical protein
MKLDRSDKLFLTVWSLAVIAVGCGFYRLYIEHSELEKKYELIDDIKILTESEARDSIKQLEKDIKMHILEIQKDSSIIKVLEKIYQIETKNSDSIKGS